MTATAEPDVYIAALTVDQMFVDPEYQRVPTDVVRARKYAAAWNPRLVGILEVSDRGEDVSPRYAIVDGQHRWAAMRFRANPDPMAVNVHTGLSVAEEADLFDKLNRQRKLTNTWDHWKARRAGGDDGVAAIEAVVDKHGLTIDQRPADGYLSCTSALEKIVRLGGTALLDNALTLIVGAWQHRRDGLEAQLIHGLALVLHHLGEQLDHQRLSDALMDVMPRQIKTQANALREVTPGTLPTVTAIVIVNLYDKRPGRKIGATHKTFGGTGVVNGKLGRGRVSNAEALSALKGTKVSVPNRGSSAAPSLTQIAHERLEPRTVPSALPPAHPETDQYGDAVMAMEGKRVGEIAQALGIHERTVRRIQSDLGIETVA